MGAPVLECDNCGNKRATKLMFGGGKSGCNECFQIEKDTGFARLHKYSNPHHKGLSEAKERVFERSFIEPETGEVLDSLTGKEAAY